MCSSSSSSILWVALGILAHGQGPLRSAHAQQQCPCIRSTPWGRLSNNDKSHAQTLGYNAGTWDMLDFAEARVEWGRWADLSAERREAAGALGYADAATWDCCINHYYDYDYDELKLNNPEAFDAVVALGYSKQYWDGPEWRYDPPLIEAKTWCDSVTSDQEDICVNKTEIGALKTLCYSPSRYRAEPLSGRAATGYVGYEHC